MKVFVRQMYNKKLITPPENQNNVNKERFGSLDGLRAYAAMGIVLMHVLSNISVKPSENYLTSELIPFFTDFTLLFMVVSGFSLCCGYYQRIKEGTITPAKFYKRRYLRILPFFAVLCIIDLAVSPSMASLYETFANMTLCFGLLPPSVEINVIGVGWFLGIVFLFYMLFPFFVFMLDNKRRALFSLVLAVMFVFITFDYFFTPSRRCMIYCAPLFITGGVVYLYRKIISEFVRAHFAVCCATMIILSVGFFAVYEYVANGFFAYVLELLLFALWLVYAIGSNDVVLNNRIVKYLSGISMEIYLAHMVIYRVVEKVHLEDIIQQNNILYIVTSLLTIVGVVCFAHIMKFYVIDKMVRRLE